MDLYPLPDDHVLPTRSAAMRYLRAYKAHLRGRASLLEADVLALGPELREPVAYMVDALARNCGHFWAKHLDLGANNIGRGMVIHHLDLDEDLMDAYETRFGEDAVEEAAKWLLRRLHGESSIFVAWALGPIRFREESHLTVLEDRILFHLVDREFTAVLSHPRWNHPDCTHFYVKGGKAKKMVPHGHRDLMQP